MSSMPFMRQLNDEFFKSVTKNATKTVLKKIIHLPFQVPFDSTAPSAELVTIV